MTMVLIWAAIIYGFAVGIWKYTIKPFINGYKDQSNEIDNPHGEEDDINEINRLQRIENYDRQIDGYTQLIKLLDRAYLKETDTKKKAAILSKQLATLEKLNKTIEKREKLE